VTTDFGWYMNTNNSSEDQNVSGTRVGNGIINLSGAGTTVDNAYLGLKDFYRMAGYNNMVGIIYHRESDGTVGPIPIHMPTQPQGIYPRHWLDQNLQDNTNDGSPYNAGVNYTITGLDPQMMWETIKREIDESRTVIACTQGWNLGVWNNGAPTAPSTTAYHANFPNTTNVYEKGQPPGLTPDGSDYYHLGVEANVHPNPNHVQPQTTGDSTDPPHWGGTALGHTILIVGYIPAGAADDISLNGDTDWLIVRDNDETTARNVIIPYTSLDKNATNTTNVDTTRFLEDMILATIYTDWTHPTTVINLVNCTPATTTTVAPPPAITKYSTESLPPELPASVT